MFSVIKTGTCRRPSCTPMVSPTISGIIIDALAQVRITVFAPARCTCSTCFISLGCTYGPFFIDRDILASPGPTHDKFSRRLLLSARLISQSWLTPRCLGAGHPNRGTTFPASVGMVHRVLRHTPDTGSTPSMPGCACFAEAFVFMIWIG